MIENKKMNKDVSLLYLMQFIQVLLGAYTLKIISTSVSQEQFGLFLIIKRFSILCGPIITLNLGVSLAYFISQKKTSINLFLYQALFILSIFIINKSDGKKSLWKRGF